MLHFISVNGRISSGPKRTLFVMYESDTVLETKKD